MRIENEKRKEETKLILRVYKPADCKALTELFYETVHSVNTKDYTKEQVDAWADSNVDLEKWNQSFLEHYTVIAEEENGITGFGDISDTGYLDRLYVHKAYQHQGIASAICDKLEHYADQNVVETHASITARPFFESRGYMVIQEQGVVRKGVLLKNYRMEKQPLQKEK